MILHTAYSEPEIYNNNYSAILQPVRTVCLKTAWKVQGLTIKSNGDASIWMQLMTVFGCWDDMKSDKNTPQILIDRIASSLYLNRTWNNVRPTTASSSFSYLNNPVSDFITLMQDRYLYFLATPTWIDNEAWSDGFPQHVIIAKSTKKETVVLNEQDITKYLKPMWFTEV